MTSNIVMFFRYIIISCVCSPQFPMGAGGDGPLGGMAGMEPHHMNGSLGTGTSSLYSMCYIDTTSLVIFFPNLSNNLSKTSTHLIMVICVDTCVPCLRVR